MNYVFVSVHNAAASENKFLRLISIDVSRHHSFPFHLVFSSWLPKLFFLNSRGDFCGGIRLIYRSVFNAFWLHRKWLKYRDHCVRPSSYVPSSSNTINVCLTPCRFTVTFRLSNEPINDRVLMVSFTQIYVLFFDHFNLSTNTSLSLANLIEIWNLSQHIYVYHNISYWWLVKIWFVTKNKNCLKFISQINCMKNDEFCIWTFFYKTHMAIKLSWTL